MCRFSLFVFYSTLNTCLHTLHRSSSQVKKYCVKCRMPPVQLVGKILKTVKKLHLKQPMSQCGKHIPLQSTNPGCGYEIAVSLNTSEDVKSTICCQGWVICVSGMGLWKTSHPSSSRSRGKIKGQWGAWARQQSIHPNSSCKPGSGAVEFPQKLKGRSNVTIGPQILKRLGNAMNHRETESLCMEKEQWGVLC